MGLPDDVRLPFRFIPGAKWSPLVVSFPHVGLLWPHELGPKPQANFVQNADYQVQRLYPDIRRLGVACMEAVFSRLVVDLNRAPDDISPSVVPDHPAPRPRTQPGSPGSTSNAPPRPGRGVVWTRAIGDVPLLRAPLPHANFQRRIDAYHRPYHRALEVLLQRRQKQFGHAILLDAHSMPGSVGADLVLGTLDGGSCDPRMADFAVRALGDQAGEPQLVVRRDRPYRGGEIVRRFGRPAEGYYALQLEVRRSLYMNEQTHRLLAAPAAENGHLGPQAAGLASLLRRVLSLVEGLAGGAGGWPKSPGTHSPNGV